ncbi:ethanolamine utilization phosphate acetyltransferase EutD [Clostridium thermobutyricum]|uniref:ethanolamine utilization phosphate acetyltransferase EutD n=1 Tax=Clostridium thermobutyricum TaxID=29372 RepID=UPI0018AB2D08|nr:ethanolamine utilization phosphate acetyltransferase EutD [Clostridium thermobutyricum]
MKDLLNSIVDEVVKRVKDEAFIEVEASGRHVHLAEKDIEKLFGANYKLTKIKDLSQPGQFACKERVTIKGPKGSIKNVVVLGPARAETQVEVSLTDSLALGVKPPIKMSGELLDTPGITIESDKGVVNLDRGLIAAKRHIHVSKEDAKKFEVKDNDLVKVKVFGERPLIFDDVVIRVSEDYTTFMHIDYDEANACGFKSGTFARMIK